MIVATKLSMLSLLVAVVNGLPNLRSSGDRELITYPGGGGWYGMACQDETKTLIDTKYEQFRNVVGEPKNPHNGWNGGCIRDYEKGKIMAKDGATHAIVIHGGIYELYSKHRNEWLGWPHFDQRATADGRGNYVEFDEGTIFYRPDLGAFEVRWDILDMYNRMGNVKSWLGYPTSGYGPHPYLEDTVFGEFEHGAIYWNIRVGVKATDGSCVYKGQVYCNLPDSRSFLSAASQGNGLEDFRTRVANVAVSEAELHVCGEKAQDRYDAEFWGIWNQAWCSEFVRFVYLRSGMKNDKCGPWYSRTDVGDFDEVSEITKWFKCKGLWTRREDVTKDVVKVGDYIRIRNNDHSAVAVGVSFDKQYIYIAEGNAGDCTNYRRIHYFHKDENYQLNDRIYGVGEISRRLFKT